MFDAARAKLSDWRRTVHVYPKMPADFEPTAPSYEVALTAHQTLLELSRRHPEDEALLVHTQQAETLRDRIWKERHA